MEQSWSIEYLEGPDSLYASLIASICSSIKNWKIIKGNESLRSLLLSPRFDNNANENKRILGSEIETKIVSLDEKTSKLYVTLRSLDPLLSNESREEIARIYPIDLLLSIGKTDKLIIDELELQDALKSLGPAISKTVLWYLVNRGYFNNKEETQDALLNALTELFGPAASTIIDTIRKSKANGIDKTLDSSYSRMFAFCSPLTTDQLYDKVNLSLSESPEFHFELQNKTAGVMKASLAKTASTILDCKIVPRTIEGSRAEFTITEREDSGEAIAISNSSAAIHKFIARLLERI